MLQSRRLLMYLEQKIDLAAFLGLVVDWKLIGPFPNPEDKGIDLVYPPEKKFEPTATYETPEGKAKWIGHVSAHELGIVDFDANLSKATDAIAYAITEFTSDRDRDIEIRIGCYTSFKLWVNGRKQLWYGAMHLPGCRLIITRCASISKKGTNTFLMKVSRAAPPPQVPNLWRFQFRVCDADGAGILSTARPPTPAGDKKS